jgi:DNA-binding XRE family transcriptional regulator
VSTRSDINLSLKDTHNSYNWPELAPVSGACDEADFIAMFVVHGGQFGRLLRFSRLQPCRPAPKCAHVQKHERRTTVRRTGVSKPNLVAAAVRLAGGLGAAASVCGVSRQTIYDWINERRVERLIDALRLSRASGVAIENLAGDDVEKLAAPVQIPRPKRRWRRTSSDAPDP